MEYLGHRCSKSGDDKLVVRNGKTLGMETPFLILIIMGMSLFILF